MSWSHISSYLTSHYSTDADGGKPLILRDDWPENSLMLLLDSLFDFNYYALYFFSSSWGSHKVSSVKLQIVRTTNFMTKGKKTHFWIIHMISTTAAAQVHIYIVEYVAYRYLQIELNINSQNIEVSNNYEWANVSSCWRCVLLHCREEF